MALTSAIASSPSEIVLAYHERTKHSLAGYARGPETLDWDAQPAPFRSFEGARRTLLPLLEELPMDHPVTRAFAQPFALGQLGETHVLTLPLLGALLQASLGITAWKSYGPDRWAVRANPSSGNLHPVEAYVVATGLTCLQDGIYHYDAREHALEQRALVAAGGGPLLCIGLSSLMWREAWKYGERAFRYCQLDTGHAAAAIGVAATLLGFELSQRALDGLALATLLGLDREQDRMVTRGDHTEREEPELLLELKLRPEPSPLPSQTSLAFYGRASLIDAHPLYRWPAIEEVARASRAPGPAAALQQLAGAEPSARSARQVLLGRRSAQRFDRQYVLSWTDFVSVMRPLLPSRPDLTGLDLVLFVHRVQGLEPGLYLLSRRGVESGPLIAACASKYRAERMPGELPLFRLCTSEPGPLMRVARALHCAQELAASSCFALGMVAELTTRVCAQAGAYRELLREAGAVGQLLYLQAEAVSLRGTGIGCFFDDGVHELLGLLGTPYRSLYHFCVGRAIDDPRIETGPAYPRLPGDNSMSVLDAFLTRYDFDASNLNAAREHGLTPLMRAALLGRLDLVEALLTRGVDVHARNTDGNTALWLACVSDEVPVVQRLVAAGIRLDNRNDTGATTLMYAASSGKDAMVALLLELGADPHITNLDGAKAVDMAASLGALKLLRHTTV